MIPRHTNLVPSRRILTEVLSWSGVHTERGRFGATAFYLHRRELGHLHGDRIADLPLPRALRDRLVAAGAAREHRWRPDSGWVTIALDRDRAVFEVLALLRTNYERGLAASDRREAASEARPDPGQTRSMKRKAATPS
ncbi:MAG: luciferase family protein [Solirubrobacteraceae bacterium]